MICQIERKVEYNQIGVGTFPARDLVITISLVELISAYLGCLTEGWQNPSTSDEFPRTWKRSHPSFCHLRGSNSQSVAVSLADEIRVGPKIFNGSMTRHCQRSVYFFYPVDIMPYVKAKIPWIERVGLCLNIALTILTIQLTHILLAIALNLNNTENANVLTVKHVPKRHKESDFDSFFPSFRSHLRRKYTRLKTVSNFEEDTHLQRMNRMVTFGREKATSCKGTVACLYQCWVMSHCSMGIP